MSVHSNCLSTICLCWHFLPAVGLKNTINNTKINYNGLDLSHTCHNIQSTPLKPLFIHTTFMLVVNHIHSLSCPEPDWLECVWPLPPPPNFHSHSYEAMWEKCLAQGHDGRDWDGAGFRLLHDWITMQTKQVDTENQSLHFVLIATFLFVHCIYRDYCVTQDIKDTLMFV